MKRPFIAVVITAAILAIGIGLFAGKNAAKNHATYLNKLQAATVLSQPRQMMQFALIDNHGNTFTHANLQGYWSLLFFGFTHCPHICPTTMLVLKQAYQIMQQDNIPTPQVIFISVDPKRDSVNRLNTYVKAFDSNFIGLTGNEKIIQALTQNLNVVYLQTMAMKTTDLNQNDYDIDHSGSILVINPQGEWAAIFSMPHDAKQIVHDFTLIQKNA